MIGVVEFRDVLDQESWLIVTDRLMIWEVQPFVELRPMQEVVEVPSRQITAMSPVLRTIFHAPGRNRQGAQLFDRRHAAVAEVIRHASVVCVVELTGHAAPDFRRGICRTSARRAAPPGS